MKNWIKIGGIAGIILAISSVFLRYYLVLPGMASLPSYVSIPLGQLLYFLPIFIYLGFMFAAKNNNQRFLKIVSLLLVISSAVFFIYNLVLTFLIYNNMHLLNTILNSYYYTYGFMTLSFFVYDILALLFGVALIYSRKINKFALITGIVVLASFVIGSLLSVFLMISLPPGQYTLPYYYNVITFLFPLVIILLETLILIELGKKTNKKQRKNKR